MENGLYKTALGSAITAELRQLLVDLHPDGDPASAPSRTLSARDEYVLVCSLGLGSIADCNDQQKYAVALLSGYRKRSTLCGELISRADYVTYHLENFYIKLPALLDRSLHLVDDIFNLGVPDRQRRFNVVAHNSHVRGTAVFGSLKRLDSFVDTHRGRRNSIIHKECYSDTELKEIEGIGLLRKSGAMDEFVARYLPVEKSLTDKYIKKKRNELMPIAEEGYNLVTNLFDTLLPVFERRLADFRREV